MDSNNVNRNKIYLTKVVHVKNITPMHAYMYTRKNFWVSSTIHMFSWEFAEAISEADIM